MMVSIEITQKTEVDLEAKQKINPPASRYWRWDNHTSSIYCLEDALQMRLAGYFFD